MYSVYLLSMLLGLLGAIGTVAANGAPAWFGPDPATVPCLPTAPCTTANTANVTTLTCPIGTVGARGMLKALTLNGLQEVLTVVCNVCFLEGTYCDGSVEETSLVSFDMEVVDPIYYCPVGKWCPNTYTIFDCPAGYYCRAGSSRPTPCFPLSICPANSSQQQQYLAYIVVIAFVAAVGLTSMVTRQAALAKTYRGRAVAKYVQRHKKQFMAWLASSRHNLWNKNGMVGPDPLIQHVVGLEAQAACKAQSFMTFAPIPVEEQITIEVKSLSIQLKTTGATVLRNVSMTFGPGKLHGIFGPSGCGKSSLLTEILGRSDPAALTVSGQVLLNGNAVKLNRIADIVGFVPQDDVLPEDLCVHEVLKYSEQLRGDVMETPALRHLRVDEVEQLLDIKFVKHSPVGAPDERGISGGQRKRVSIGMELVTRPNVLVADELTTGLDATTAFQIMQVLKRLCERTGMTIVVTIHQPRPQIFDLFDNVVVLAGGQLAYQGSPHGIREHFTNLGFVKPEDSSTPDFVLDVVSGLVPRKDNPAFLPTDLIQEWNDFTETLHDLSPAQLKTYRELQARASQKAAQEKAAVTRRRHDRRTMTTLVMPSLGAHVQTFPESQTREVATESALRPFGSRPPELHRSAHVTPTFRPKWLKLLVQLQDSFWTNFGMTILTIFCCLYSLSVYLQHSTSSPVRIFTATTNSTIFTNNTASWEYPTQPIEESRDYLAIPFSLVFAEGILSLILRCLLVCRVLKVDAKTTKEHQCDIYQAIIITAFAIMVSMLTGFYAASSVEAMFGLSCSVLLRPIAWGTILAKGGKKGASFAIHMKGGHVSSMSGFSSAENDSADCAEAKSKETGAKLLQQVVRSLGTSKSRSAASISPEPTEAALLQGAPRIGGTSADSTSEAGHVADAPQGSVVSRSKSRPPQAATQHAAVPLRRRISQSIWHQTAVFLKRAVRQEIARARVLVLLLILLSGLGLVVGLLFGPQSGFYDLPLRLLLAQISLSLVAAASGIQLLSREKVLYYRERATGTSPLAYFIAKNLVHFPLGEMQPVFFMITYVGLSAPAASFWDQFVVFSVIQFVASGIGMVIAVVFRRDGSIAMICIIMVFMLLSTFNPKLEYFENSIHLGYYGARAVVGWSFARWTSEALFIAELRGFTPANQLRIAGALSESRYDMDHFVAPNLVVAIAFGVVFRIIAYFVLTRTNKAAQGSANPGRERKKVVDDTNVNS